MGLGKFLIRPFQNLTALERFIQCVRIVSACGIVVLSFIVAIGPSAMPKNFYMSRLDTSSADITSGIFTVLRDSIETAGTSNINNGVGLTTSEILILTSYTASQVDNVPQYVMVSLYGRCDAFFSVAPDIVDNDVHMIRNSTITTKCYMMGPDYIFDYREILKSFGLNIVLDYAYNKDQSSSSSSSSSYTAYIKRLRTLKSNVVSLLFAVGFIQLFVLVGMFSYYSIKGRYFKGIKERLLVHIISFLSLAVFVSGLVCVCTLAWINLSLQGKIKSELQAFGFSYHLGSSWFSCLWLLSVVLGVHCFVWSGIEWCVSASDAQPTDSTNDMILGYKSGVFTDVNSVAQDDTSLNGQNSIITNIFADQGEIPSRDNTFTAKTLYKRNFGRSGSISNEEYELQSITLNSSDGDIDDNSFRNIVVPSSTMHF